MTLQVWGVVAGPGHAEGLVHGTGVVVTEWMGQVRLHRGQMEEFCRLRD